MKKLNILLFALLSLFLISFVSAQTTVEYYYGQGCRYCATVIESGVLEEVGAIEGIEVQKYEIYYNNENRQKFIDWNVYFGIEQLDRGVPFAVVTCEGTSSYIVGTSIIDKLKPECVLHEGGFSGNGISSMDPNAEKITLGAIIIASLIDSINPCAFGVLIFLMLALLKMGSAKRALKYGIIYTFVVFLVYFLAGFGIFKAIQSFTSITKFIYLFAGILVLLLGVWQFKDVFLPNVGPKLQISSKAKPMIENLIHKGTLPAMILLGIVVSLFELPCTGGIYLGILSLMSMSKTFAIGYLLLYNLIFVLPLIILTFLIYKGTSPEMLQRWTGREKKWMKIGAGLVLIGLGLYILLF